jgi:YgiT-type zinc finger domain-containing protein
MEARLEESKEMKCVVCNQTETVPGVTSVLFEHGQMTLTVTNVPARICPNCGEAYADETVTGNLLRQAEKLAKAGGKMETREYEGAFHVN